MWKLIDNEYLRARRCSYLIYDDNDKLYNYYGLCIMQNMSY